MMGIYSKNDLTGIDYQKINSSSILKAEYNSAFSPIEYNFFQDVLLPRYTHDAIFLDQSTILSAGGYKPGYYIQYSKEVFNLSTEDYVYSYDTSFYVNTCMTVGRADEILIASRVYVRLYSYNITDHTLTQISSELVFTDQNGVHEVTFVYSMEYQEPFIYIFARVSNHGWTNSHHLIRYNLLDGTIEPIWAIGTDIFLIGYYEPGVVILNNDLYLIGGRSITDYGTVSVNVRSVFKIPNYKQHLTGQSIEYLGEYPGPSSIFKFERQVIALDDEHLMILGGWGADYNNCTEDVFIFSIPKKEWRAQRGLPFNWSRGKALKAYDGSIYCIQGYTPYYGSGYLRAAYRYPIELITLP